MSRVEQISDYKLDSLILSEKIAEIEKNEILGTISSDFFEDVCLHLIRLWM